MLLVGCFACVRGSWNDFGRGYDKRESGSAVATPTARMETETHLQMPMTERVVASGFASLRPNHRDNLELLSMPLQAVVSAWFDWHLCAGHAGGFSEQPTFNDALDHASDAMDAHDTEDAHDANDTDDAEEPTRKRQRWARPARRTSARGFKVHPLLFSALPS